MEENYRNLERASKIREMSTGGTTNIIGEDNPLIDTTKTQQAKDSIDFVTQSLQDAQAMAARFTPPLQAANNIMSSMTGQAAALAAATRQIQLPTTPATRPPGVGGSTKYRSEQSTSGTSKGIHERAPIPRRTTTQASTRGLATTTEGDPRKEARQRMTQASTRGLATTTEGDPREEARQRMTTVINFNGQNIVDQSSQRRFAKEITKQQTDARQRLVSTGGPTSR